jgi:hypothetical protein
MLFVPRKLIAAQVVAVASAIIPVFSLIFGTAVGR